MKDIVIGFLKSNNTIKLKKAFIEKLIKTNQLIDTETISKKLNLNIFLKDLEKIWHIDEPLMILTNTNFDIIQLNDQIKFNYDSIKQHFDLIKLILTEFNLKLDFIDFDVNELETHLTNLFKSIFLTNLNRSNSNILIIKNTVILLMTWTNLIIESFSNRHDIKFFLIPILNMINLKFSSKKNEIINYYYFIQNDYKFSTEYLNLINSFDFIDLINHYRINENFYDKTELDVKFDFIETCLFETICLLLNSMTLKQNLLDQEQQALINLHEIYSQDSNVLIKEFLNNLNKIVSTIKYFVNSSDKLFEWSLKYLIDLITENLYDSDEPSNNQRLGNLSHHTADLFKCFDLNKAKIPIVNYFNEIAKSSSSVEDAHLRNLLISLIYLLQWPFDNIIDEWICLLMTILATKLQKFKLLINFCRDTLDFVLRLASSRSTRVSSINVLCFFIINYQHSPVLFHKSCPKIGQLLEELKPKQLDQDERSEFQQNVDNNCYQKLYILSHISISNFSGYPEIYKPILDIIQNDIDLNLATKIDYFKLKYLINGNNLKNIKKEFDDSSTGQASNDENMINYDDMNDSVLISKFRPNISGLINLGNTCYLNCIMQSLFACKKFVKNILEIDTSKLNSNVYPFLSEIQVLFSIMYLTNRPAIKPSNFVKNCTPEWFKFGQQQDSSEFLIFLLDNLNEQLKLLEKNESLSAFSKLIQKSFGIHLKNECECSKCHTKTSRTELSFYLPLSFSNNQNESSDKVSLQTLIDNFFHTEQLSVENGNPYSCSNCQSLQTANKRIIFTKDENNPPPDYLIFTLNRFICKQTSEGLQNIKIMDQLDYPIEISINSLYKNENVIEKYKIVAIVVHSGSSLHYGHYYSYIRNKQIHLNTDKQEDKIEWLLANDSQISQASFDSLISNLNLFKNDTPYVLFYKRVLPENEIPIQTTNEEIMSKNNEIRILNTNLLDKIAEDNITFEIEEKNNLLKKKQNEKKNELNNSTLNDKFTNYYKDDDDDQNGPRSSGQPPSYCSNDSQRDSGPRVVF